MKTANNSLHQACSVALVLGGIMTLLANGVFAPLLPVGDSVKVVTSLAFLLRQTLSAFAALFLLLGVIGIYCKQKEQAGRLGLVSLVLVLLGNALLLAQEWNQIFFVRDLGLRSPATLLSLNAEKGMALSDIGSMIAFVFFVFGWLVLSLVMLRAKQVGKTGPGLILVGLLSAPLLGSLLPGLWGLVIGNVLLGSGWIILGLTLPGQASVPTSGSLLAGQ